MNPNELVQNWKDDPNSTTDDYLAKRAIDAYMLDTKAGVLLGFASLLFALIIAVIPYVEKEVKLAAFGVGGFGEIAAAIISKSSIVKKIPSQAGKPQAQDGF